MKSKLLKILTLVLAFCMLVSCFVSCSRDEDEGEDTTAETIDTSVEEYSFPESISFSDGEFNILNFDDYYNAIVYIDTEDTTTKVSNEVYKRNVTFEETYGVKIVEERIKFEKRSSSFKELTNKLTTANLAGDDLYDATYVSVYDQPSLVTSGILKNLNDVSTLNLSAEWWDKQLNESYMLASDKCYMASSPLNLMSYEMTWLILFNQQMAAEFEMPSLYDYVRKGEWTIEKMLQLVRQYSVATPNSDASFDFDANGVAQYGIALHSQSPTHFLTGFGINFIQPKEDDSVPYKYGCSNADYFQNASELLLQLFDRSAGMAIGTDWEDDAVNHPDGYVPVFGKGRSLFVNCELKSGMTLKRIINTDVNYGILPMPKFSKDQESYMSDLANSTMMFAIPSINDEFEATGLAADVLSYMSYRDVIPVYYGDYVSYRNANDPESLEMLDTYIMPGRCRDKGVVYGWTGSLVTSYDNLIYKGQSDGNITLANILSIYSRAINTEIKTFYGTK